MDFIDSYIKDNAYFDGNVPFWQPNLGDNLLCKIECYREVKGNFNTSNTWLVNELENNTNFIPTGINFLLPTSAILTSALAQAKVGPNSIIIILRLEDIITKENKVAHSFRVWKVR